MKNAIIKLLILFFISNFVYATEITLSCTAGELNFLTSTPSNVSLGNFESNTAYTGFKEVENYTLPQDFVVNLGTDELGGSYGGNVPANGTRKINSGTVVDVFYIHFDPVGSSSRTTSATFEISGGTIIGVVGLGATHDPINSVMAQTTNITYDTNSFGLHSGDIFTFTSLTKFTLNNAASTGRDPLRVFVTSSTAVPEPCSLLCLAISILFLSWPAKLSKTLMRV